MGNQAELEAETQAYEEHMNNLLAGDKDLPYLPLEGLDLFKHVTDGVLLSKLLEAIKPGTVNLSKLNHGADVEQLKKKEPGSKDVFKITENQNLFLDGVKKIPAIKMVNIGSQDLIEAKQDLVLGLIWQLIRYHLMAEIHILSHPELIRLMRTGETIQTLLDLTPEQLLLRWFNYHLKRAGSLREVTNFGESIKDSECYLILMRQVAPKLVESTLIDAALDSANLEFRAVTVLQTAEKLNSRKFVTAKDILAGHQRLNLAFTATLFNNHIGIQLPTEEEIKALFDRNELLAEEVSGLKQTLAQLQESLRAKTEQSESSLASFTKMVEQLEKNLEAESERATFLHTQVETLQRQNSAQDRTLADLRAENQEQKQAFERVCNDQSSVNGEIMKRLQSTESHLKETTEKYEQANSQVDELTKKLQEQSASAELQLKRQKSMSAKSHQTMAERVQGDVSKIMGLLKDDVTLDASKFANEPADTDADKAALNLKKLHWMVEQLVQQKRTLSKKVDEQAEKLTKMKQMNDLMAEKVKEIAEEMNQKHKSKK